MIEYTKTVLQKYAVFTGRARRAEYWYFCLATFLATFILGFVLALVGVNQSGVDGVTLLVQLAIVVPSIAVGVRRMHDIDKSGWFLLIPFYNLYLLIQPGTVGPNRFGLDPKATGESVVPMAEPVPSVPPLPTPTE